MGPILTLAIKSLVGQEPSDTDYKNATLGLSALYDKTTSSGLAAGGIVGRGKNSKDELKKLIEKAGISAQKDTKSMQSALISHYYPAQT